MKITTTTKYLLAIFLIALILYFPSLKVFYTNDDFFLLKISQANSLKEFLNFFNLTQGPDGLRMYRPLTTQVFYFLGWKVFNLNPLGLHVISFLVFFAVIYLVYVLAMDIFTALKFKAANKSALLAAFLYATSATHFGHLYYLAAFQELGMTFFFLLSTMSFVNFLTKGRNKYLILSILYFLLSLLSKETAVVLPLILILVYWFLRLQKRVSFSFKKFLISLVPYFSFLLFYFYFRIFHYGFATGDSYIWDFSLGRVFNTLGWYGLWSFNLPEMLVDFLGPGFHLNPNLFKFWSREIIPIFILFSALVVMLSISLYHKLRVVKFKLDIRNFKLEIFGIAWFVLTLLPVLFLPLHKFTFYLALPLTGGVIVISYLLIASHPAHRSYASDVAGGKLLITLFLVFWLSLSVFTLNLTRQTHWITMGAQTAKNVHNYLTQSYRNLVGVKTIAFYDTPDDKDLPWSPSEVLKVVLSDQNYFKVFWDDKFTAKYYTSVGESEQLIKLKARNFLGY